ncbi:MAG: hypothetical protein APR53_01385 [Methanoculleus sp. SDB]|nr:MAG: hypothetical protein APR53_01385 [Methanoculleus sp. SDB]
MALCGRHAFPWLQAARPRPHSTSRSSSQPARLANMNVAAVIIFCAIADAQLVLPAPAAGWRTA